MDVMAIEIRQAQPDDQGPLAELMYSSGMDLYNYLYGDQAIEFLKFEFQTGKGFAGYRNVTVAISDDLVLGTGCFYDGSRYHDLVKGSIENMVAFFKDDVQPVLERISQTASVMPPPREGELYLSNFGVSETCRSQGIGSKMIQHTLEQARRDNYSVFGLDVSTKNPRGQALYTKLGLEVTEHKTFPAEDAGVVPVRKMEMAL
jgi:ribosomal protein S18 acetylase RimI-like enzyme